MVPYQREDSSQRGKQAMRDTGARSRRCVLRIQEVCSENAGKAATVRTHVHPLLLGAF